MENLNIDRKTTIAFTGHRSIDNDAVNQLLEDVRVTLLEQYNNGYRTFITGMAVGFDLLVAEEVLKLQEALEDVQLICAIPYKNHHYYFSKENRIRVETILYKATSVETLSDRYFDKCYLSRNDYMLSNCSLVVAYCSPTFRSGTAYTMRRAAQNNIPTINLYK